LGVRVPPGARPADAGSNLRTDDGVPMSKRRFTGAGAYGLSAQWEFVEDDRDLARALILFLEDRRVLFGVRHLEDEYECVRSALDIRKELHGLLLRAKSGKQLEASMRAIQAACRDFVTAGGRDGERFRGGFVAAGMDPFASALAELRVRVGIHVGLVADFYQSIELGLELASIVPRAEYDDDAGWVAEQVR
jgi:hypothetical protein